jgi:ribonuclease Z
MEFQFLGTSSGTPSRSRNVSGLALSAHGGRRWALVDCGEGTQHRILRTGWSLHALDAIFITHLHGDHCYGLPGLLASAGMLNRSAPLPIVGPAPLQRYIEGVIDTTQLGLPFPLRFVDVGALRDTPVLPELAVHATPLSHRIPSYAYTFVERDVEAKLDIDKLRADGVVPGESWGRLQRRQDVRLADGRLLAAADYLLAQRAPLKAIVAGDNDDPDLLRGELAGAHLLVHEATYTQAVLDHVGPGPQHSSARMVARTAAQACLPNLVLTHFSPRYQGGAGPLSMAEIEREARASYDGRLFLANDFDRFRLDRDGVLAPIEPSGR